ncbi:MAG: GLPGLI family protein [Tetragenococcus halophilus]|nr:GLPGLI family protein [Tetragenococcus halophilus]MDN6342820.1 GLPGLI family protein [Lactococcus lactis]
MKRLYLILIISLICASSDAQKKFFYNSAAEYSFIKQTDSTDKTSKKRMENFSLYIGDKASFFVSNNRINLDTLLQNANFSDIAMLKTLPKASSNKRILKKEDVQKLSIYNEFYDKTYHYNDAIDLKWKILNVHDSLNRMKLRKAETQFRGRKYIAWYTDEIPASAGPYKFSGLPGLIVKLQDTKNEIEYSMISFRHFKKNKTLTLAYDQNGPSVSKNEYRATEESFYSNPIPYMEEQGAFFSEETKRIIKQKFKNKKKQNSNPIELKDDDL